MMQLKVTEVVLRLLGMAYVPLLIGVFLLFPLAAYADDIVLGATKGDVRVLVAGSAKHFSAGKGQVLRNGDRVYTGLDGWATLIVPDGSRLVLTADSEFVVRSHDAKRRTGTFALLTGMLRAIISPSAKSPPNYRFNTMTAVAGVRGTDFSLIHRGQANVFFGNNGTVAVQGLNTPARPLTSATVVQTTRGEFPTQPIRVEANSRLAEAQALLNTVTEEAPASWVDAGKLPEIVARWNITYSRYLADAGRNDEALHVLQVALDLTDAVDIQADARLERGAVFSRSPTLVDAALKEYAVLLNMSFTGPQRETALYMSGIGNFQLKRIAETAVLLRQYLSDYPEGRYRERVKTLLHSLETTSH
jgi:hypothetical protein